MTAFPEGYGPFDTQRFVDEPPKQANRTPFERDRARIVHSAALRRLGAKTQVLGAGSGDFVRTRLTHSLEVAQVGRGLGKELGCDPDVVDAACLAHDLGHPPFGHNGERALDYAARDIGGFEGNAQTLRLLTRLEPKSVHPETGASVGLNLTRATLDASIKYPWRENATPLRPDGRPTRKFGVYDDDLAVFEWLREGAPERTPSFEAQVMDIADDIAYSVHDVEDAVVHNAVALSRLRDEGQAQAVAAHVREWYGRGDEGAVLESLDRLRAQPWWMDTYDGSHRSLASLKDMTSQLIGRFLSSIADATRAEYGDGPFARHTAGLVIPEQTAAEILLLKGVAVHFLMAPRETRPAYKEQREKLIDLVAALADRGPDALEQHFAVSWQDATDDAARLRVAVDQVASLTDKSAYDWHHKYVVRPKRSKG
ncbi:deoxyguanosinetriphosphate triphosphohydrolase [Demequina sp. TTPB684]|uniref:deoxyguanosinetriphosphate triphosphohydrolase n=1 Tax=unclassified Demequina TaxID=2620311 RepID=UPI001CF56118|nr:deoxyguanosinetriphosphate triphosphohydrolase [Demequina sp. TMPB413]MCB2411330.1 deoxyguanosinetriphosphate triphosphohydrolase [Demequina sp. TTPB684]UPU88997.1 deoxyguanosinetriphosphate triphosphohydrolase [Demequina sp. TMPB413]